MAAQDVGGRTARLSTSTALFVDLDDRSRQKMYFLSRLALSGSENSLHVVSPSPLRQSVSDSFSRFPTASTHCLAVEDFYGTTSSGYVESCTTPRIKCRTLSSRHDRVLRPNKHCSTNLENFLSFYSTPSFRSLYPLPFHYGPQR